MTPLLSLSYDRVTRKVNGPFQSADRYLDCDVILWDFCVFMRNLEISGTSSRAQASCSKILANRQIESKDPRRMQRDPDNYVTCVTSWPFLGILPNKKVKSGNFQRKKSKITAKLSSGPKSVASILSQNPKSRENNFFKHFELSTMKFSRRKAFFPHFQS